MRRRGILLLLVAVGAGFVLVAVFRRPVERTSGPLIHEAYVWQRAWTASVQDGVAQAGKAAGGAPGATALSGLIVLGAEVGWERGRARVVHVAIEYEALRASSQPVGLALRVGPYAGPFDAGADVTELVVGLAGDLVKEAKAAGVNVKELQIDFDCAESKLDGYRLWVQAARRKVAPVPVTITVLPSWLNSGHLRDLVRAADGFVLQVHSLERPEGMASPLTLCDPSAARSAVEKAARLGVPFRVAMPTYGYLVAFDASGKFVGVSAEGPAPAWPADVQIRTVRADPAAMAELVRSWTADRPATMTGIIWYRLPVSEDTLNWRWATLSLVMDGQAPRADLRAQTTRQDGLVEVHLVNTGTADAPLNVTVTVRWDNATLVSSDAIGGFERTGRERNELRLTSTGLTRLQYLAPGDRRAIGWLRLSDDKEVQVHVVPINQ